jgi:uracil-DNA glycosylase family 4
VTSPRLSQGEYPDPDVIARLNFMYNAYRLDWRFDDIRNNSELVLGDGPLDGNPELIFVGEAPGRTEAAQGRPFVGRSGQLLDSLIKEALGFERIDVWVTNLVKYWPGDGNPDPGLTHMEAGLEYLRKEIQIISGQRRVIVPLGRLATSAIMKAAASGPPDVIPLGRSHGRMLPLKNGFRMFPMYHPAWALRGKLNEEVLRKDFDKLRRELSL